MSRSRVHTDDAVQWVPSRAWSVFMRTGIRLLGMSLVVVAVFLGWALYSYSPDNPSLNTAAAVSLASGGFGGFGCSRCFRSHCCRRIASKFWRRCVRGCRDNRGVGPALSVR